MVKMGRVDVEGCRMHIWNTKGLMEDIENWGLTSRSGVSRSMLDNVLCFAQLAI